MPVKENFTERDPHANRTEFAEALRASELIDEGFRVSKSRTAFGAMEASRFTDEEVFFLLTFADRLGYDRAIRALRFALFPLREIRRKLVYFGGWEAADLSVWEGRRKAGLDALRDDPTEGKLFGRLRPPFPLTLFSCLTLFGGWWQLKTPLGYLVKTERHSRKRLYLSPNGTPQHEDAVVLLWRSEKAARISKQ